MHQPEGRPAVRTDRWLVCGLCLFLVAIIWAVFGQTGRFEFVNYDDQQNVYENPVVQQGLSFAAVGWAFTHTQVANWIPLTTLSHMLDCQLFGLHAGGHHLVNVFWHAAATVLLFLALNRMTGRLWRSAFVAAVFAVHPLRAESVAWVSERKDVLSAFFFMLLIGVHVWQVRKPSPAGRIMLVLLFALGLMAKSMIATLPFVLLLLDYWPLRRCHNRREFLRLAAEKIPLFVLAAAACLVAGLATRMVVRQSHGLPLLERTGNALVSYVIYLRQLVCPTGLATPYPMVPNGPPSWLVGLALLLLAAITAGVVAGRKQRPWLLVGWLWYLGMLFPVIGIIQISPDAAHADRYTYLSEIGLVLAVTWWVAEWSVRWKHRRWVLGGLMAAVVGGLMAAGLAQTSYWREGETLWRRALACTADNSVAHNNIGYSLYQKGRVEDAVGEYHQALKINPDYAQAHFNLGVVFLKQGDLDNAVTEYHQALKLNPDYMEAHFDLGGVMLLKGELDEAAGQYRKALALRPDYAEAAFNLGRVLLLKGDMDEALARLNITTAVGTEPPATWYNLGNEFLQERDWDCARACYLQTLKINPGLADAYANLGVALSQKKETKAAVDAWQKALEINPDQVYVLNNLAWLLAASPDPAWRDGARAEALARHACQLTGGNPMMLRTLAAAYGREGSYELAAATAKRALELAVAQKNDGLAATLETEITRYEANTPVEEPAP